MADGLCACNPNRFFSSAQADSPMRTRTLRRPESQAQQKSGTLGLLPLLEAALCFVSPPASVAKPDLDLPGPARHASPAWNNLPFVLRRGQGLCLPLPEAGLWTPSKAAVTRLFSSEGERWPCLGPVGASSQPQSLPFKSALFAISGGAT